MTHTHYKTCLDEAVHFAFEKKRKLLSQLNDVARELEHLTLMYDGRKHPDYPDSIFIKLPDGEKMLRLVKWNNLSNRSQPGVSTSEWDTLERIPLFKEPMYCRICGEDMATHKLWIGSNDSVLRSIKVHSTHIAHRPDLTDNEYVAATVNMFDRVTGIAYFTTLRRDYPSIHSRYVGVL